MPQTLSTAQNVSTPGLRYADFDDQDLLRPPQPRFNLNLMPGVNLTLAILGRLDTGETTDMDEPYGAILISRGLVVGQDLARLGHFGEPVVLAKAQPVQIAVGIIRDFRELRAVAISLAGNFDTGLPSSVVPNQGEYRVIRKAEGLDLADITVAQVVLGDGGPIDNTWQIDRIEIPENMDGER